MKKTILLLVCAMSLSMAYSQNLMILNFEDNATDQMTTNRYTQNSATSGLLQVVDNPVKTGINTSSKALKMDPVNNHGMFGISLCGYWNGTTYVPFTVSSDSILVYDDDAGAPIYDRVRFKYYVVGYTAGGITGTNALKLEFYDPTLSPQPGKTGVWTNTLTTSGAWSDWNEITYSFTPDKNLGRILIYAYEGWGEQAGVQVYIDDIEFLEAEPPPPAAPPVMIANFEDNGTDRMITNRIREEVTPFEVVNNPKSTTVNSSAKVLKMYPVTSAGRLAIGLCGYYDSGFVPFTNSSDSIVIYKDGAAVYDNFRFKLYLEGTTTNTALQPYIEFHDYSASPQPTRTVGSWENALEGTTTWNDWNTFTFPYSPTNHHGRMILVINNNVWGDDAGVTFYVDDIEFFNSNYVDPGPGTSIKQTDSEKLNYILDGKQLSISEISAGSVLSIYDISGKCLLNTKVNAGFVNYNFADGGIYIVSLKNETESSIQKIMVK